MLVCALKTFRLLQWVFTRLSHSQSGLHINYRELPLPRNKVLLRDPFWYFVSSNKSACLQEFPAPCYWVQYPFSVFMILTLTLPGPSAGVSGSLDSCCSLKPLCSGMGEVVPARTSPTLLPPSPRTVLSLSCFTVSQCINCRDWHCKS